MCAKKVEPAVTTARLLAEISRLTKQLESLPAALKANEVRKTVAALDDLAQQLASLAAARDPIKRPTAVFDPSNPKTAGRIVALTLLAQERVRIAEVPLFYGSGVYAVYYNGKYKPYKPLVGSEHPIYIGKADPKNGSAVTAIEQGTKLFGRLREHNQKSIERAVNLQVADFDCRSLVVQSGYQAAAEDYLIKFFRPIWNKEIGIAYGIGKHGDSATTRGNKRSPWDTLHPGRGWASATAEDQKSELAILEKLKHHFGGTVVYKDFQQILSEFVQEMGQV